MLVVPLSDDLDGYLWSVASVCYVILLCGKGNVVVES